MYERRRADTLLDSRIERIETKVDALQRTVFMGMGALAILSVIVNIAIPIVLKWVGP
jgi:hypothetical protein